MISFFKLSQTSSATGLANGSLQNWEENLEPAAKRRKLLRGSMDDGKVCWTQYRSFSLIQVQK